MKLRTTILLAVIFVGLSSYYLIWEKPVSISTAKVGVPLEKVFTLAEGDRISWLMVQNQIDKEVISLKRDGENWWLEFPVSYPAENILVEGMISALTYSNKVRRLSLNGQEKKEFGFDSPKIKVGIATEKEPRPRYLIFGETSPVNRAAYAWWEGEKDYFMIPLELRNSFERTVYSLRQKKIFRSDLKEAFWMHTKSEDKEFRLEKQAGKWYWIFPPLAGEIPPDKVNEIISSFEGLYVREFMDGQNLMDEKFGFGPQATFISIGTTAGNSEKLVLGKPVEGKEAIYAVRENDNVVLAVSEGHLKALLQKLELTFQEMRV